MKKITKRYLCKLGYFKESRLLEEEERRLNFQDENEDLILINHPLGNYFAYRINDEEIDTEDVRLFLRARLTRTLGICAVICAVCMILITLAVWI